MTTHEMMDLMGSDASPAEAEEMIKLLGDRQHQDICWLEWKAMLDTATERSKRAEPAPAPAKIEFPPADLAGYSVSLGWTKTLPGQPESFAWVTVQEPGTHRVLASEHASTLEEALAKVRATLAATEGTK
jgi:hypothetical protein